MLTLHRKHLLKKQWPENTELIRTAFQVSLRLRVLEGESTSGSQADSNCRRRPFRVDEP